MTDRERIKELAGALSFNLGLVQGETGQTLFDNYPDNFNELIPKLAAKLIALGYTRQPPEPPADKVEYEPVGLEALGDEEIINHNKERGLYSSTVLSLCREISLNTIQHNQAKGQLFRVKE